MTLLPVFIERALWSRFAWFRRRVRRRAMASRLLASDKGGLTSDDVQFLRDAQREYAQPGLKIDFDPNVTPEQQELARAAMDEYFKRVARWKI